MTAAVEVVGVSKRFGRTVALADVSFDVPEGSLFGLLGPNGAGKTTLFGLAAGFLRPTAGTVRVLGTDVEAVGHLRGRLTMLPQDAAFQSGIPVIEQLVMFCRLNGMAPAAARRASQEALELVGLAEVGGRAARALSHGMAKRVALCQAFLGDPEVVFLDEPTSGLDPENARRMRDLVRRWRGKKTIVLSSHDLREVQEVCDEVAILHRGVLLERGSMADLTAASHVLRLVPDRALDAADLAALGALPGVTGVEPLGDDEVRLRLALPSPDARADVVRGVLEALLARRVVPRAFHEGASLEERFLEITKA